MLFRSCVECHTQQVRPKGYGNDYERGWGRRRTVAQDYLRDYPVQLGSLRLGSDLANVSSRQPSAAQLLKLLYNPRSVNPDSRMPRHAFLFEKRVLASGARPDPNALPLDSAEAGYQVIPTADAHALVAYLMSLRADAQLFEAPFPVIPTNSTAAVSAK